MGKTEDLVMVTMLVNRSKPMSVATEATPHADTGATFPPTVEQSCTMGERAPGGENGDMLDRLNHALDRMTGPYDANESLIEFFTETLAPWRGLERRKPLLLTARLAELTLLCAGSYADSGSFTAAGDLLFNPRRIMVHFCDGRPPAVKHRHGRMSDQFRTAGEQRMAFIDRMKRHAIPEHQTPPVFSELFTRLAESSLICPDYLATLASRETKVSDTIGFLSAWGIDCPENAWQKQASLDPECRQFFESNLCRFSSLPFCRLGDDFRKLQAGQPVQSPIFRTRTDPHRSAHEEPTPLEGFLRSRA